MVEKGGFWVIGILLHCDQPNVFWREFSQACEYYLLARGISSENLLFQQRCLALRCRAKKPPGSPTVKANSSFMCFLEMPDKSLLKWESDFTWVSKKLGWSKSKNHKKAKKRVIFARALLAGPRFSLLVPFAKGIGGVENLAFFSFSTKSVQFFHFNLIQHYFQSCLIV